MSKQHVLENVERVGLVPVVRASNAELAARAVEAMLAGGVSIFEITMTVPDAVRLIGALCDRYAGRAVVGAGTVLTVDQARACIDAGAQFVVSPGLDVPTVEYCRSRDVAVMPGSLTPTEVITAWKAGADMVKIFPCSALGGAKYLKALKAPLPDVKLLPTGGVSLTTLHEYVAAGASALGVGAELVDIAAVKAGQDASLTERARQFVEAVGKARAALKEGAAKP
jgi:2-dehydro-3-deoxyphosphogluconate aldolase / (4S)-4-hydroxy-2-oxoglutarate aldolase